MPDPRACSDPMPDPAGCISLQEQVQEKEGWREQD
jgi:hypothetical protein